MLQVYLSDRRRWRWRCRGSVKVPDDSLVVPWAGLARGHTVWRRQDRLPGGAVNRKGPRRRITVPYPAPSPNTNLGAS
jgi:hypothetical protein